MIHQVASDYLLVFVLFVVEVKGVGGLFLGAVRRRVRNFERLSPGIDALVPASLHRSVPRCTEIVYQFIKLLHVFKPLLLLEPILLLRELSNLVNRLLRQHNHLWLFLFFAEIEQLEVAFGGNFHLRKQDTFAF